MARTVAPSPPFRRTVFPLDFAVRTFPKYHLPPAKLGRSPLATNRSPLSLGLRSPDSELKTPDSEPSAHRLLPSAIPITQN